MFASQNKQAGGITILLLGKPLIPNAKSSEIRTLLNLSKSYQQPIVNNNQQANMAADASHAHLLLACPLWFLLQPIESLERDLAFHCPDESDRVL